MIAFANDKSLTISLEMQLIKIHNAAATGKASVDSIAVYSFALKPEEHQPSGTCNFSRIDNAQLKMHGTADNALQMYTP